MFHLLLHRRGEGNRQVDLAVQVVHRDVPVFVEGLCDARDDGLFDLGAVPAFGGTGKRDEVEGRRTFSARKEVEPENLLALLLVRQVYEKDLIESTPPDHLRGKEIDPIGGRGDEDRSSSLLHPCEEVREDAGRRPRFGLSGEAHLDLVQPEDGRGHCLRDLEAR